MPEPGDVGSKVPRSSSSSSASPGMETPRSNSVVIFSAGSATGSTFQLNFRAPSKKAASSDIVVVPSIESGPASPEDSYYDSMNDGSDAQIPSVSITPPARSSRNGNWSFTSSPHTPESVQSSQPSNFSSPSSEAPNRPVTLPVQKLEQTRSPQADGIDSLLRSLRPFLMEPNLSLSELTAAIGEITKDSNTHINLSPEPRMRAATDSPSPSPSRPISRRRSSSRANLQPHDVHDEMPSNHRFYEPKFQKAFGDAKRQMAELRDVLGSSSLHIAPDSSMKQLHGRATELSGFQCPSTRTVGFVGDSGVGKSSLLNALLDMNGLARMSNNGAACTCVATEYIYHDSDGFAIETEFFTKDEITKQLTELLRAYRHFHLNGDDLHGDEKKSVEEKAGVARDTFRAMFRGRMTSENFLVQHDEKETVKELRSWVKDTMTPDVSSREIRSTLVDCSLLLMQLTSEQAGADGAALWPFIRKIKVYLKAHILSKGLVLVDLPGLRDLNLARRNVTERALLHCDEIFAICNIGRATTDVGVASVFEMARKAKLTKVGIICTRSDDIRPDEAMKDWKGQRARDIEKKIDMVEADKELVSELRSELKEFDAFADELADEEQLAVNNLNRDLRRTEDRLEDHQFELDHYLITSRNQMVTQQLKAVYKQSIADEKSSVFCISNTGYWKYRDAPKSKAMPHLTLSGILAVREHCMSLVAESQLQIGTKYIKDDISALLGDVELWVQSGAGSLTVEKKQAVRRTLDDVELRLKKGLESRSSKITTVAKSLKADFRSKVCDLSEQRDEAWRVAAVRASRIWNSWHSAFCRNYGNHYTQAAGSHDWNAEVIEAMTKDLRTVCGDFISVLENSNRDVSSIIEVLMEEAILAIETDLEDTSDSTNTLTRTFESRQNLLLAEVQSILDASMSSLDVLNTDALSSIRTSYIGKAMEESYETCNNDSGRGSDGRRKTVIGAKVGQQNLFRDMMKELKNAFGSLADDFQRNIQAAVDTHLDYIRGTMDIIRSENIALESEQDSAFRFRVDRQAVSVKAEMSKLNAVVY